MKAGVYKGHNTVPPQAWPYLVVQGAPAVYKFAIHVSGKRRMLPAGGILHRHNVHVAC